MIENQNIKILDLRSNEITDTSVTYLSEMIQKNQNLSELNLESKKKNFFLLKIKDNSITEVGVKILIESLKLNSTLKILKMKENNFDSSFEKEIEIILKK